MHIFFLHKKITIYKKFTLRLGLILIAICWFLNIFIFQEISCKADELGKTLVSNIYNLQTKQESLPFLINFPNPFTQHTYIYVRLPRQDNCEVKIFDIFGNFVISYSLEGQREYIIKWEPKNSSSRFVSTGGYICVLNYNCIKLIRKIGYIAKK